MVVDIFTKIIIIYKNKKFYYLKTYKKILFFVFLKFKIYNIYEYKYDREIFNLIFFLIYPTYFYFF